MKPEHFITPIAIIICAAVLFVQQQQQQAELLAEQKTLAERIPEMALKAYDHVQATERKRKTDADERSAKWDAEWKAKQELEAALKHIPADVPEPKRTLAARELIRIEREEKAKREDAELNSMPPQIRDALKAARQ